MTMAEAAEMIGLTYEDIADESAVEVMRMFAGVGMATFLRDKKTGEETCLYGEELFDLKDGV